MKYTISLLLLAQTLLLSNTLNQENNQELSKKHLQKQLQKEQKYAQEQRFYSGKDYDLKSHEVDMESVKNLPDVEDTNADFDMDNVYD